MAKDRVEIEIEVGAGCNTPESSYGNHAIGEPDRGYPRFEHSVGAPSIGISDNRPVGMGPEPHPHDIGLFDPGEHG
jgi:hypothetical protein